MKRIALIALILTAPLAAQSWELGVFAGQQSYKSNDILSVNSEVKSKTVLGARLGYSIVDLGPALLQVTAGFQPKTDSEIDVAGMNTGKKYQHQHTSVGVMFNFKAMVAFGAGVEYRMEKLNATNSGISDVSYSRPWLRANIGYAFPSPVVKPFLGLEVALPLTSKSFDLNGSREDGYRSFAPKLQIGIYGGIRF